MTTKTNTRQTNQTLVRNVAAQPTRNRHEDSFHNSRIGSGNTFGKNTSNRTEGDIDLNAVVDYENLEAVTFDPNEETPEVATRCLTEAQYAQAFQNSFRKTLRFLRSRGASEDLAEEVAQEAWARGWERLHQLRNPDVVDVWVASIAKHLWRNRVVRDQRNRELSDNIALHNNPNGKILWQQITKACGDEEQKLLNMHYVRGYTSGEIAERLGSTALAIRLRLMRTRRKLEQLFGRELLFAGA